MSDSIGPGQGRLNRRSFLFLAPAVALLAGCNSHSADPQKQKNYSIDSLLGTTPFYIAHRGSGDNWTEHSELAYSSSIEADVKSIEVSVQATSDGIFICHHDTNLLRMTGQDLEIKEHTYATIATVMNDSRQWLGPNTALEPIPLLKSVLDAYATSHVIFIEDKQGTNTKTLLDLMDSYKESTSHFVWKQSAGLKSYMEAHARGYKTWGYFIDNSNRQFEKYAPHHDYLGIYHLAADEDIRSLVGYGKPTICWEVHTRWTRDRLLKLGIHGLMCSNILYVRTGKPRNNSDTFSSGIRNAGDLPSNLNWKFQPPINPKDASISLADGEDLSYCMGSLCPVEQKSYALDFRMRWPQLITKAMESGIAFGQLTDEPYLPSTPGISGYHLMMASDGSMTLSRRSDGESNSSVVAVLSTPQPRLSAWVSVRVTVTPTSIEFTRQDVEGFTKKVADAKYRGGYFSLVKDYHGTMPTEFSSLSVQTIRG